MPVSKRTWVMSTTSATSRMASIASRRCPSSSVQLRGPAAVAHQSQQLLMPVSFHVKLSGACLQCCSMAGVLVLTWQLAARAEG